MSQLMTVAGVLAGFTVAACSETSNESPDDVTNPPKIAHSLQQSAGIKTSGTTAPAIAADHSSNLPVNTSCANLNLQTLSGFTDVEPEESCRPVTDFQLKQFKCVVSENAFGANLDAFNLQTAQLSVYAYPSLNACQDAVDTRNANGY